MKDAKCEVLERLLNLSRLIRRRGTPDEAMAAAAYEKQFERELKEHEDELSRQELTLAGTGKAA